MRALLPGILIYYFAINAIAQCPVSLRQGSIDLQGQKVTTRYYNSGTKAVTAIEFIVTRFGGSPDVREALAHYSTRVALNGNREATAIFHGQVESSDLSESAEAGSLEVQVTRVVFADQSTWKATNKNPCKIPLSLP